MPVNTGQGTDMCLGAFIDEGRSVSCLVLEMSGL